MEDRKDGQSGLSQPFWHSDQFAILPYLLGSASGFVGGTTGLAVSDEFRLGHGLSVEDFVQSVVASAMLLVGLFDFIGPRYVAASVLMVPATMGLIRFAMRLNGVNAGFAAICGIPIAFIFMAVTMLWRLDDNGPGRLEFDLTVWTAIIVGGMVGGLTYFASGKLLGLWKNQPEPRP
ncbi:MAG: hypothetical protein H6873_02660 [Hyphomicrobiaceae bacterium]|nr:hypothetical protein [Hyphomicrobiaceae bacterium]